MLGHNDQARQCSGTESLSVVAQSSLSPVYDNKYIHHFQFFIIKFVR